MLIGHRCVDCGHTDWGAMTANRKGSIIAGGSIDGATFTELQLLRTRCDHAGCKCAKTRCKWGEPELFARYQAGAFGVLITELCPPGTEYTGATHTGSRIYACNCDACQVFYVGAVALSRDTLVTSCVIPVHNVNAVPARAPAPAAAPAAVAVYDDDDGPDDGPDEVWFPQDPAF